MIQQSEGKIFLAGERGHTEQDWCRSYNTFNFGSYQHLHKTPFGPLYMLNDDTLAGGRSLVHFMEQNSDVIIVPTVGAVRYCDSTGNERIVQAGQALRHGLRKGTTLEISNPYESELVNFIQIWVRSGNANIPPSNPQLFPFDLDKNKNKLLQITGNATAHLSIGKFAGREEAVCKLTNRNNGIFFFVVQGAFEVQYRLLEAGDGLSLWGITGAELEALSNDAIILAIEVPLA